MSISAEENLAEPSELSVVDRTHRQISDALAAPSRWFDDFFQHPRLDEEPAKTFLRLRGSVIAEEGEKLSFKGKAKVRLRLPNLKRRFHLILSSEEDDLRDKTLKDARNSREAGDNDETSLALQYTQKRSSKFNLSHRIKLDLKEDLDPHIRSRARYSIPIADESILTLTQTVFWDNDDGFGEETRVYYDLPLNETVLLRASGDGLFSEGSNGYEWLGMLQWLQSFSRNRALTVGSYVAGETRPHNYVTEYDAFIKYRQRVAKKWLFVELKPELKWTRENDFRAISIFTFTVEVQFGGT